MFIRILFRRFCLPAMVVFMLGGASARAGLDEDRVVFAEVRAMLQSGQREKALAYMDALKDYPLLGYLRYLDLKDRLASASNEEISAFLRLIPDGFMADEVRRQVLRQAARQEDWSRYRTFDAPTLDSAEFQCQRLVARGLQSGPVSVLDEALALWADGKGWPDTCERLEDWLAASGRMNAERLWARIEQAMEDGRTAEARRLAARAGADSRIPLWQDARKAPARFLSRHKTVEGDRVLHLMLADAVKRLAREDAREARAVWQGLAARAVMAPQVRSEAEGGIATAAARQHLDEASDWFEAAPASGFDEEARAWRVRAALRQQRWDRVLAAIEAMSAREQSAEEWRYWRARAMDALGQRDDARRIWQDMARGISYYGLLAADRSGMGYGLSYVELPSDESVTDVALRSAMRRAREFHVQGLIAEARKEWQAALRDMDPPTQRAAAHLAARWGWMDRAAITMGKARNAGLEDLEVRFPLPWRDEVERFARAEAIDSGWMFGVMRRESAFMPDIGSSAGAQGLMQLMPATAKYVAKKTDLPPPERADLHDPETNMRLGSAYLRYVLDKFGDNQVLATAAYNAGPGRVKQWMPKGSSLPADIWVDTVPFTETREYCRAVLHYATIFEWRLYGEARPLSTRMPNVTGG
ncbi:MAG: transglycosylase SLT domain-containing protein [Pseudomonadota bacterium]